MTISHPSLSAIKEARARLGDLVLETPIHHLVGESVKRETGTDPYLKLELFQYAGSFKPRGALTVMFSLDKEQLSRGVTAISAGNHAIAVGYCAQVLGTSAKVVMTKSANPARIQRCADYGVDVVLMDNIHDAFVQVREIEEGEGRFFVHPFEGPLTALGTATLGLELTNQVADLDAVIVPIGGGGLCAGVATAVKLAQPDCKVYGVEPFGADSMTRSFASGKPEAIEEVRTIADSLGAPYAQPYSLGLCQQFVDEIVLVDDDALCRATALLFHEAKLAVEPAAAAATAALCGPLRDRLEGKRVGLIICGTNIDRVNYTNYLQRGERGR